MKSERGLRYECLQPKPAWCLKQLKTDVEPMIIFWVGLGSCTFVGLMYGGTFSTEHTLFLFFIYFFFNLTVA